MTHPEFDNSMLLSAILSGGVIGGSVGLLDKGFDRAKWAIPAGMLLGIFLDYQLKKRTNSEHIEIVKDYFVTLWVDPDADEGYHDEGYHKCFLPERKVLLPETNAYWNTLLTSMAAIASVTMMTYGFKAILGKTYSAGIGPITVDDIPAELPVQQDETLYLPAPERIDEIALGNPVLAYANFSSIWQRYNRSEIRQYARCANCHTGLATNKT